MDPDCSISGAVSQWIDRCPGDLASDSPPDVLLGVSGGADSMVLLHLCHLAVGHGLINQISVAHINHMARGIESDRDAQLVVDTCQNLNIPVSVTRVHVDRYAAARKRCFEESARILRYHVFSSCLAQSGGGLLLLGHNRDDNLENFFIRMMRGSGFGGLGGMRSWDTYPFEVSGKSQDWRVGRPLLPWTRDQIRAFADQIGIVFRDDSTNDSDAYTRNRVRNCLVPAVSEAAGDRNWRASLENLMGICQETDTFLKAAAHQWLVERSFNGISEFSRLPVPVQSTAIIQQLKSLGIPHPHSRIQQLLNSPQQWISTDPKTEISLSSTGIVTSRLIKPNHNPFHYDSREWNLKSSTECQFKGLSISMTHSNSPSIDNTNFIKNYSEVFDAELVGDNIKLRHWHPGDTFVPIGSSRPTKLKKWFSNQKIPKNERHALIIAESDRIGIFWIQGLRISELAKISTKTTHFLHWQWREHGQVE